MGDDESVMFGPGKVWASCCINYGNTAGSIYSNNWRGHGSVNGRWYMRCSTDCPVHPASSIWTSDSATCETRWQSGLFVCTNTETFTITFEHNTTRRPQVKVFHQRWKIKVLLMIREMLRLSVQAIEGEWVEERGKKYSQAENGGRNVWMEAKKRYGL